jgi:hypothetical protein
MRWAREITLVMALFGFSSSAGTGVSVTASSATGSGATSALSPVLTTQIKTLKFILQFFGGTFGFDNLLLEDLGRATNLR